MSECWECKQVGMLRMLECRNAGDARMSECWACQNVGMLGMPECRNARNARMSECWECQDVGMLGMSGCRNAGVAAQEHRENIYTKTLLETRHVSERFTFMRVIRVRAFCMIGWMCTNQLEICLIGCALMNNLNSAWLDVLYVIYMHAGDSNSWILPDWMSTIYIHGVGG